MRQSPLLAILLVSCAPATHSVDLAPALLSAPTGAPAIRLYSAVLPRCPFEEVALITSRPGEFTSSAAVVEGLRSEARRLGGDAVVHVRVLDEVTLTGTAIRFTTPGCTE